MRRLLPFTILACFLVLACFNACRKDVPVPHQCVAKAADVKDWMYFEVGSYFVYEEEHTGAIDCLYVTQSWVTDPEGVGIENSHYFFVRYESSYSGYSYLDYRQYNGFGLNCDRDCLDDDWHCFSVEREKSKPFDVNGPSSYFLFYPHHTSINLNGGGAMGTDTTKFVNHTPKFYLNDSTEAEVLVFSHNNDFIEDEQRTLIYYGKHFGVVRKELLDSNQVWNLKRWNILQ